MASNNSNEKSDLNNAEVQGELKNNKKLIIQESLNTKNFIKKMTSKKGETEEKAQKKITSFITMSNTFSVANQKQDINFNSSTISSQDQKIRQLEERMKSRDLEIQKMKRARQVDEHRFSELFVQNKQNIKKSRYAIAKSMLQAAQFKRAERRQINPKLGYFKDGLRIFVQGTSITELRAKILDKQQLIKELQEEKKSKDSQKKQRAIFKIQFIQKELSSLQRQLQNIQKYTKGYMDQLKLADKQSSCEFASYGWSIVYNQYQPLELLGKGGFGEVYKCYDLDNNQLVALKVNHFNESPEHREQFIKHVHRQAQTVKKLNHPHIAKFQKILQCNSNKVVFAMQYCSGPELSLYLKKNICLQEKQAKQIIRQIFSSLKYLSSLQKKVIHYDLKPSNIIFHHGLVKLLDFGLCKPMGNQQSRIQLTSQGVGTYWYLSPETFYDHEPLITPKVDIWSAGVIFYEMLYGKKPFGHGVSQDKIYNQGIILNAKKVQFPNETPKKYKVSDSAKNFIRQCLAYNQQERLSPVQAYEHDYFKK